MREFHRRVQHDHQDSGTVSPGRERHLATRWPTAVRSCRQRRVRSICVSLFDRPNLKSYLAFDVDATKGFRLCRLECLASFAGKKAWSVLAAFQEMLATIIAQKLGALLIIRKGELFGQPLNLDIRLISVSQSAMAGILVSVRLTSGKCLPRQTISPGPQTCP